MLKIYRYLLVIFVIPLSGFCNPFEMQHLQKRIDLLKEGSEFKIPPGVYYGNLNIKKPVTLHGDGKVILDGKKNGSVVEVNSPDVQLVGIKIRNSGIELGDENSAVLVENSPRFTAENLIITDSLFGIQLRGSPHSKVNNTLIKGLSIDIPRRGDTLKSWYSSDIEITNNTLENGRDMVIWYSHRSKISNNKISKGRYGIHFMYSHDSEVRENTVTDNLVGIYMMYSHGMILRGNNIYRSHGSSGFGIALKESDKFHVVDNNLIGNRIGVHTDNSPMRSSKNPKDNSEVAHNNIAYNHVGLNFIGRGAGILIGKNDFDQNWVQVSSKGVRKVEAEWLNNYWSDYTGIDLDGNGFGTFPYRAKNIFNNLMEKNEGFKVFSFGPAIIALNFTEKLFPWFNADLKFEDKSPHIKPWKKRHKKPIRYSLFLVFPVFALGSLMLWRFSQP